MDEMKQAFDQVAEDGMVQPGQLLSVLQRRNPGATEADAQSLIEMMRQGEDEDVSFSGGRLGVLTADCISTGDAGSQVSWQELPRSH